MSQCISRTLRVFGGVGGWLSYDAPGDTKFHTRPCRLSVISSYPCAFFRPWNKNSVWTYVLKKKKNISKTKTFNDINRSVVRIDNNNNMALGDFNGRFHRFRYSITFAPQHDGWYVTKHALKRTLLLADTATERTAAIDRKFTFNRHRVWTRNYLYRWSPSLKPK